MQKAHNQNTYLKHQNQQAYLLYCQQIICYLSVLNWLKTLYLCEKSAIYNEKCASGAENLNQDTHQHNPRLKSLKHQGKSNSSTTAASGLLYETNTIGNVLAKYHYGSDRALAETRNGQNSYIYHDALRTPIAITNQDGSIQNRMDYDVYGNLKSQSGTTEHPIGFTGYHYDADTGLYYAKARYYSPEEGRFIRNDPLEGNVQDPPSLHRYLYANANPTAFIDPTGEGNDTPHYYDALLIGSLVGLNEYEAAAFALGAQITDEFFESDAINNSAGLVGDSIRTEVNNCGNHALCNVPPEFLRRSARGFVLNDAKNLFQVGTADHAFTDSYFHIGEDEIHDLENQMLLKPRLGHVTEWKSTDKSYLYHKTKRIPAFKARALLLYQYTVKQGTQKLSPEQFEEDLNLAVKALDEQHSKLLQGHQKFGHTPGGVYTYYTEFDENTDRKEFNMVRDMLEGKGLGNIPRTENHSPAYNVNDLLNDYSEDQLRGIILAVKKGFSDKRLKSMSKTDMIEYINGKLFKAQAKSAIAIYIGVQKEKRKAERVKENDNGPGNKELSK